MKRFKRQVDLRSRKAMVSFLTGHFRYDTMNSWNRSTSYANCLKIHTLDFPAEVMSKAWDMLDCDAVYAAIREQLHQWAQEHDWIWQACFNGRSDGYLVLYRGGLDHANTRTAQCDVCGKLTWHKAEMPCTTDGCDGVLQVLEHPLPQIFALPGKSVDLGEDYEGWDMEELRERVRLVQSFDELCDRVVDTFVGYCRRYNVVTAQIHVPHTIKTLEPVGGTS